MSRIIKTTEVKKNAFVLQMFVSAFVNAWLCGSGAENMTFCTTWQVRTDTFVNQTHFIL